MLSQPLSGRNVLCAFHGVCGNSAASCAALRTRAAFGPISPRLARSPAAATVTSIEPEEA